MAGFSRVYGNDLHGGWRHDGVEEERSIERERKKWFGYVKVIIWKDFIIWFKEK